MNMTIVVSKRCISNLKIIYNYNKLSKHGIHGFFLKLFLILFTQINPGSIIKCHLACL